MVLSIKLIMSWSLYSTSVYTFTLLFVFYANLNYNFVMRDDYNLVQPL